MVKATTGLTGAVGQIAGERCGIAGGLNEFSLAVAGGDDNVMTYYQ